MSAIASSRSSRLLWAAWAAAAAVCAVAMYLLPGHETIPFHLIWFGLCVVYGFTAWRPIEMMATIAVTSVVTGGILVRHASTGHIEWAQTAEVPLSIGLAALVAVFLRKRHMALAELARLAQQQQRQAMAQQLLVRHVSHELRTPITVARGYTELISKRVSDPVARQDIGTVLEELDRLADITERLVTLIQVDGSYERESVDLDPELIRVVRRWTPIASRRWKVRSTIGEVLINRDRFEAALDCLLDNAVRFTEPGDSITVTGAVDGQFWTIEVADTGAGMPPADAEALSAGQTASARTSPGSGLGLPTVRTIAGAWGGTTSVRSQPGAGTVVTLRFPWPQPRPSPPPA